MRVKEVTIGKELLVNLGNYSNIKISHYMTVEIGENEEPDFDAIYDTINHNLTVESEGMDPRWVKRDELKDDIKLNIYIPKRKKT